jgi:hypothetical protein
MENKEALALIASLFEKRETFSLQVANYTWPESHGFNLFDFSAKGVFQGIELDGRGTSTVRGDALLTALMELLERIVFLSNNLRSSNGIAAHFSKDLANENAKKELIERQVYLLTWLAPLSFKLLSAKQRSTLGFSFEKEVDSFEKANSVHFEFFYLASLFDHHVFATLVSGRNCRHPFGACFGLGASKNPSEALFSSFIEGLRHTVHAVEHPATTLSLSSFDEILSPGPSDQRKLLLNPEWFEALRGHMKYENWDGKWSDLSELHTKDIKMQTLDSSILNLTPGPVFVRAFSPSFLPFFIGRPGTQCYQNEILLNLQKKLKTEDFRQTLPHLLA